MWKGTIQKLSTQRKLDRASRTQASESVFCNLEFGRGSIARHDNEIKVLRIGLSSSRQCDLFTTAHRSGSVVICPIGGK